MPSRKAKFNGRFILILMSAALVSACLSKSPGNAAGGSNPDNAGNPNNDGTGGNPNNDGTGGNPDNDGTGGTPGKGDKAPDCISDRVKPPSDGLCACDWKDCEATTMSCKCDLSCYGNADKKCSITVDSGSGKASSDDGTIGSCDLSCSPEDDLSTDITCSASGCEVQPNVNININPDIQTAPPAVEFDAQRQVAGVDVLFMIDNSSSMQDNQMASACAMNSFFEAAGQNGAKYQTGVLTTDLLCETLNCTTPVYSLTGEYQNAPALVSLAGTCASTVSCNASNCQGNNQSAVCKFGESGQMASSDDSKNQDVLRQLVVQGDKGSHKEGGLEKAFQYFAEQERKKTFDPKTPKEIIVISDEQADADAFLCPFKAVDRKTSGIPDFTPPTPTNTQASCDQDLIDFYSYYFKSRNIIVHGLLFTDECSNGGAEQIGTIYEAVIKATGGHEESICSCDTFKDFFSDVGKSTSTLSTELCFDKSLPDPSTIEVYYVENGAQTKVPQSAQDGWTLDNNLKCLVMNGSWKEKYGNFHIKYLDPDGKQVPIGEPTACLSASDIDPIARTIQLSCNGKDVPQSSTDGYTYDASTRCFTFHGSNWSGVVGSSCSVKYN